MKVLAAEHVASAASPGALPPEGPPEVAFLGRSNVGKSSLLNRLAQRRRLARTSATPGKTRLIHFYEIRFEAGGRSRSVRLVDLPGYGWARVSKAERRSWQQLVEGYLEGRRALRLAVLLQDLRRDVTEDETALLDWLGERSIAATVALTKTDKLKPRARAARVRAVQAQLEGAASAVQPTSAVTGEGIEALWRDVARHLGPS